MSKNGLIRKTRGLHPCSFSILTKEEWDEYISLVDAFAVAKIKKDYQASDKLRAELQEWQGIHESDFIEMYESGKYTWHHVFETMGSCGHRYKRLLRRIKDDAENAGKKPAR